MKQGKDKALRGEVNASGKRNNQVGFQWFTLGLEKKSWALELERLRLDPDYTIYCITLDKSVRFSEFLFPHL